jgi:hypothetical protein
MGERQRDPSISIREARLNLDAILGSPLRSVRERRLTLPGILGLPPPTLVPNVATLQEQSFHGGNHPPLPR